MSSTFAKIGAIFYILWGILHFQAAWGIYKLGAAQGPGMVQGRLWQDSFFLFLISVATIFVAVKYNWKNRPLGYWLNLFIVSIEDLLFIFPDRGPRLRSGQSAAYRSVALESRAHLHHDRLSRTQKSPGVVEKATRLDPAPKLAHRAVSDPTAGRRGRLIASHLKTGQQVQNRR